MARKRTKNIGLPPRVYWKNGAYRYSVPAHQKVRLKKSWIQLGKTMQEMWQAHAKLQTELNNDSGMMLLFERYEKEVIPKKATRTQSDNAREIKNLKAVFGKMEPEQLTQAVAYQYLDIRGESSRTQANHEIALLRHIMSFAVRWGKLHINPLLGMQKLHVPIRTRTPTETEVMAVRAHADALTALWIDFKWQTGLRQGDMLALPLKDLKQDGIHVTANKNQKNGRIDWTDDLRATTDAITSLNKIQGMTLFCNRRGRPLSQGTLQHKFRRAVVAAIQAGDLQEPFTENDIRSSFATESEEQGINATDQLLHKSSTAKKHYVHRQTTAVKALKLYNIDPAHNGKTKG